MQKPERVHETDEAYWQNKDDDPINYHGDDDNDIQTAMGMLWSESPHVRFKLGHQLETMMMDCHFGGVPCGPE